MIDATIIRMSGMKSVPEPRCLGLWRLSWWQEFNQTPDDTETERKHDRDAKLPRNETISVATADMWLGGWMQGWMDGGIEGGRDGWWMPFSDATCNKAIKSVQKY